MNEVMRGLLGRRVKVWSIPGTGEHTDEGILEQADGVWLALRKISGELLCFSAYNVRLIKLLE